MRVFIYEIPDQKWETISINFITNLPQTKNNNFNSIFVIVDKLFKMAKFIPRHITDILLKKRNYLLKIS